MSEIVVVGAGQAAFSMADRLRREGFDGGITMIGDEPVPPYQRPPLSKKYLTGEMALERLFFRPADFYAEHGIRVIMGRAATAIDRAARAVEIGAERIGYDMLALTTGAVPRRLPARMGGDLPRVHVVRTLADVDAMAAEFAPGRRVLIVGGGYIGLEAAAVAATRGLEVTLVEAADRILNRVASPQTAAYFRALHRDHGVTIREGAALEAIVAEGDALVARLADGGRIAADFVIAGIGIVPDTRLAEAAGLACENGILVDAHCRTSDPAIFAGGDCAAFPHGEGRLRLESVGNAIDMGEAIADAMLGRPRDYVPRPWFWSDQYDVTLQIAGLSAGHDRVVERPGERAGGRSWWYFRGDRLLSVDAVGDARAYMMGKRWIEAGASPSPQDVADPEKALKSLPVS